MSDSGTRWRAVAVIALATALGGCMRTTAVDSAVTEKSKVHPWTNFFLFGTIGEVDVDVRLACPGPAARVQTYDDAFTLLISFASVGIYTPRRVEVFCGVKKTASGAPP